MVTADVTIAPLGRLGVRRPFLLDAVVAAVCTVAVSSYYLWLAPGWPTSYPPSSHSVGVQLTAYRLVQEALTNVVKHARAARVTVVVEVTPEGLTTRVTDDGEGFDPAATPDGRHGLTGMRERVRVHEGSLQLDTHPGDGTSVIAWLPLEHR